MPITSLEFTNAGPFDEVQFVFDDHINVFVGPNNSGKSATLMLLGELLVAPFGFPRSLLHSTPANWAAQFRFGRRKTSLSGVLPTHLNEVSRAV